MTENKKNRLLIVEDSVDVQKLTKELFESEGYEVNCASNGQEALDFLRKTSVKPNLILLDLRMPIMDGYEFRKQQLLDINLALIRVVVVSADGNAKEKAAQVEAQDFFNKANGVDEYLEVVKRNCVLS